MKIRTQLTLIIVLFGIALLVIAGSIIMSDQQVDRLGKQQALAKNIETGANELSYLSGDYVLYRESQQAERWNTRYNALESDLAALSVDKPGQQVLVDNLNANMVRLENVFAEISSVDSNSRASPAADQAAIQVSWSRLAVQTQGMAFDAGRLSQMIGEEMNGVKSTGSALIMLLMGTFSLFVIASYLIVYRRTLGAVGELQEGTRIIGEGNLEYAIPETGDDEISDLSKAFNRMTANLREVMASKSDLEREVADRKRAEMEVSLRNEELHAMNEELYATQEELREALAEKEVLLSEIHHRVKNNLTALISLLSLEGTYEDTEDGRKLRNDLQNRARSMALIHETLYRTKNYSSIDMGFYLNTLIEQIAATYMSGRHIHTIVKADGVNIDIARATPCGLIINELVTNSFKYAFPDSFDCLTQRKSPCTILITLERKDGTYILTVGDNGIGLPETIDIAASKSLGLKLVNFLAKHQLRADVSVVRGSGTTYTFRFS